MGFTYAVESHPAVSRRVRQAPTRIDATREAIALAQLTHLPTFVYVMPAHKLWATVDANGSVHALPDTPKEV